MPRWRSGRGRAASGSQVPAFIPKRANAETPAKDGLGGEGIWGRRGDAMQDVAGDVMERLLDSRHLQDAFRFIRPRRTVGRDRDGDPIAGRVEAPQQKRV